MKKRVGVILLASLLLLIVFMGLSTPSINQFDEWIEENYQLACDEFGNCQYDDRQLFFHSFHVRNAFIFSSYEKIYVDEDGKKYLLRLFGMFHTIFLVEEGELWKSLYNE